jgi:hypothetical protein
VFVPVLYLALVWIAVWKYRRRWQSAIILLLSPVPLLLITSALSVPTRASDAAQFSDSVFIQNLIGFGGVLHIVSGAYILAMLLIGTIIAVARPSSTRVPCGRCAYDLAGTTTLQCPECGGHLSKCVQELRMQVYMADREALAANTAERATRSDSTPSASQAGSPRRRPLASSLNIPISSVTDSVRVAPGQR